MSPWEAHRRGRRWVLAAMIWGGVWLAASVVTSLTGRSWMPYAVLAIGAASAAWPTSRSWHWFGYARGMQTARAQAVRPGAPERMGRRLLEDLDRCEHGRHRIDSCLSCPTGESTGNLFVPPGTRIGTSLYGHPIVMPADGANPFDQVSWDVASDDHR